MANDILHNYVEQCIVHGFFCIVLSYYIFNAKLYSIFYYQIFELILLLDGLITITKEAHHYCNSTGSYYLSVVNPLMNSKVVLFLILFTEGHCEKC